MDKIIVDYLRGHPGEILLFFFAFAGAIIVAGRTKTATRKEALTGLFSGVVFGYALPALVLMYKGADFRSWYLVGAFTGYIGNRGWTLIDNVMDPLMKDPWAFFNKYAWGSIKQYLKQFITQIMKEKDDGNSNP